MMLRVVDMTVKHFRADAVAAGRGCPPGEAALALRCGLAAEEKARIGRAAAAARRSISDWLRVVAEEEIERQFRAEGGARESAG